jgi:FkbM family methyltransferase
MKLLPRINNLYKTLSLGFLLGATFTEKIRMTWFILWTKIERGTGNRIGTFRVRFNRAEFDVSFRNNFADVFVLYEAFVSCDYALVAQGTKVPRVIFDVGANLGFVSLYFKALFPQARIYCFEPDPENLAILKRNIGQFSDVSCMQQGIGAQQETRSFFRSRVFHMRNSLVQSSPDDEEIHIDLVSLSYALQQVKEAHVDIMKMDVEGAEREIVPAFQEWQRIGTIVGELHPHLLGEDAYTQVRTILDQHYAMRYSGEGKKIFFYGTP